MTKGENTDLSWCLTLDVFKNFKTKKRKMILMNLYYLTNILLEKFCEKIFKAKKKLLDSIEINCQNDHFIIPILNSTSFSPARLTYRRQ